MKNKMVLGKSRIFALSLLLLSLVVLAGADDKNKKPASAPPPPPSRPAPQQSRPSPQVHTPQTPHGNSNTQMPHSNTNTQMPHTNSGNTQMPHTNNNSQIPRTSTTSPYQQGNKVNGSNVNKGTPNGPRGNLNGNPSGNLQNGKAVTGNTGNAGNRPPLTPGGPRPPGPVKGPVGGPVPSHTRGTVATAPFRPAPRSERMVGDKRVAFDRGGRVRDIHARGMDVHRTLSGRRTFVAERNGRRMVGLGPHRGYVQRNYISRGGRVYVQRTYVVGGVRYASVYRSYSWRGGVYYNYVPAYYYRPAFYGWVYNPWPVRVTWGWGWGGAPWYGYYGYYFTPYPVYPSASFWLTDYVLAANLQTAYADQQGGGDQGGQGGDDSGASAPPPGAPGGTTTVQLSPEVKQMIADEVQRQLAAEREAAAQSQQSGSAPQGQPTQPSASAPPSGDQPAAASDQAPPALDPNSRVFVVSGNLDVAKEDGSECSLTAGDVIMRTGDDPDGTKVGVNVVTSKRGDCPSNTRTQVEISDLQEMQNQFRQQLDSGLKVLADDQGKNGMPSAPDTGTVAGEAPAPSPDANATADLNDQQKAADQAETDVKAAVPPKGN